MKTMTNLAEVLLINTKNYPKMYASDSEALIMRVSTILEMADENFNCEDFYKKHLNIENLKKDFDEQWVNCLIDDALSIIKNI